MSGGQVRCRLLVGAVGGEADTCPIGAKTEGRDGPVYRLSNGDDFHSEDDVLAQLKPGEKITELVGWGTTRPTT
ncbi:hypothetical protein [Actinacidiphila oryziradicis]|uniref:hypothetical protein n=1 Tax=Actinacidiphila oryziradicis TaxID=2571141 RepID=UPI0023F1F0BE|nr:hypothetical protein [Actinacidiphila oryziradicis]